MKGEWRVETALVREDLSDWKRCSDKRGRRVAVVGKMCVGN